MTHQSDIKARRQPKCSRSFPRSEPAIVTVRNKIERALRNHQSAHFDQKDLRAVVESNALEFISSQAAKEIAKWLVVEVYPESKPDRFGSNGAKTAKSGKSLGTTEEARDEHAESAASRRASQAVEKAKHRRRKQ